MEYHKLQTCACSIKNLPTQGNAPFKYSYMSEPRLVNNSRRSGPASPGQTVANSFVLAVCQAPGL